MAQSSCLQNLYFWAAFRVHCVPEVSPQALHCWSFLPQLFQKGWLQKQKKVNTVLLGGWMIYCWFVCWLCVQCTGDGIRFSGQVPSYNSISISLKMRLSTPFWVTKCIFCKHYCWWCFCSPWLWCPSSFWITWTAHNCFSYPRNKAPMGLCLKLADFKRHLYSVFQVYLCEEEYYFHVTFPLLVSWPCKCFVSTKRRSLWFLEGRYQGQA